MLRFYAGVMEVRGVLFDFGYTLFAHATLADTIVEHAGRLGRPIPKERATTLALSIDAAAMDRAELAHPRDLDATVWAARWRVLYGLANDDVAGLGDALFDSMHDPLSWVPYQDTATTLSALRRVGISIGIVSNTGWDVRTVFEAHRLIEHVESFTLSYECGAVKPDPKIFATACESIHLDPERVLMVGDDPRSDAGAVAAGIRTMLLPARPPGSDNGVGTLVNVVTGVMP